MAARPGGFTLVETIVALVLLEIAMLALAATAAVAARDLSDAIMRRRAFEIARNRSDWLRAGACTTGGSGIRPISGGMIEHWRVEASGASRAITDSVVTVLTRGRTTAAVARASALCGP